MEKSLLEIWSNEDALKGIDYKPVSYVSGNVANTYLYGYDKDGNKVYEKHVEVQVQIDKTIEQTKIL